MRLILGLAISDLDLKDARLRKLKTGLNKKEWDYKWVPQEFLHISLMPLGEKGQKELEELKAKITVALKMHPSFQVKLSGIWAYPEQKEGRLLWIGVQNAKSLRSLYESLRQLLGLEETEYRPILPIIRLKNFQNLTDIISPYKGMDFGKIKIDKVVLYDLMSGGAFPQYKVVNVFELSEKSEQTE